MTWPYNFVKKLQNSKTGKKTLFDEQYIHLYNSISIYDKFNAVKRRR